MYYGYGYGYTILWILIAVGLAFIPASIAKKKGYSFFGFWVFGLFLWLVAIIVAACLSDKTKDKVTYVPVQPYYAPPAYRPPVAPPPYSARPAQQRPVVNKPQPPPEKVCPYCGNKYSGDKTTCDSCGARL